MHAVRRLGRSLGRAAILDNDAEPTASMVAAAYVREGGTATINVGLSAPSGKTVTRNFRSRDITATGRIDYTTESEGSITFMPGEVQASVSIETLDDSVHEGRESFSVELLGGDRTTVVILDNDPMPELAIDDVTVGEGGGSATLTVSMSGRTAFRVGIAYATHDGTATAGEDYTGTTGTLVFAPGEVMREVSVAVRQDDDEEEGAETFTVRLSAPEHAQLLDAEGIVTISDVPLQVSVFNAEEVESSEELTLPVRFKLSEQQGGVGAVFGDRRYSDSR